MLTASSSLPAGSRLDLEVVVLNLRSQRPEPTRKGLLLIRREVTREMLDIRDVTGEDVGDQIPPLLGDRRQNHTAVVRATVAVDQTLILETVT